MKKEFKMAAESLISEDASVLMRKFMYNYSADKHNVSKFTNPENELFFWLQDSKLPIPKGWYEGPT